MTDEHTIDDEMTTETVVNEHPDGMTEQIEAGYGPMNVYVSGTDNDAVLESFKEVWDEITDTQQRLHEQAQDEDDDGPGASAFG